MFLDDVAVAESREAVPFLRVLTQQGAMHAATIAIIGYETNDHSFIDRRSASDMRIDRHEYSVDDTGRL